jgi:hypothetical protein
MRSRTAKFTLGVVALIVFGAEAFFLVYSEKQIAELQGRVRAFDLHARETTDLLADLRPAQQAYVAAGQGIAFWMPKVSATRETATKALASLREVATSSAAKTALDEATTSIGEFGAVDTRAREYLKAGQQLMAADVVFTEGAETATAAARHVEAARLEEHQALDASEAAIRRQEAFGLLGAGIVGALVILLLAAAKSAHIELASSADENKPIDQIRPADEGFSLREKTQPPAQSSRREQAQPPAQSSSRVMSPLLKVAAEVCTDFGRVQDIEELKNVLGRAARVIEANGAVVWLGSTAGADLRPVLSHGYSSQTVARMQSVPKSADNAAAAAYRTGALQIVLSQPGGSTGAIVAPLLSPDGCIGALSVETKGGGETSDSIQALAGIFAAQLAGVLAASAAETASAETKTAVQG